MTDLSRLLAEIGHDFNTCTECPPKLFTFQVAIMSQVPIDFLCNECRAAIDAGRAVCLRLEKKVGVVSCRSVNEPARSRKVVNGRSAVNHIDLVNRAGIVNGVGRRQA